MGSGQAPLVGTQGRQCKQTDSAGSSDAARLWPQQYGWSLAAPDALAQHPSTTAHAVCQFQSALRELPDYTVKEEAALGR